MTCPNLNHPLYKRIVEKYNKHAAYLTSNLFDKPEFIQWKGDDEMPGMDENGNVSSNMGDTFSVYSYLEKALTNLSPTSTDPIQFDLTDPKSENYELVGDHLQFRKAEAPKYQKPHKVSHIVEKDIRDLAERLKSKFNIDYEIINEHNEFWAGKFHNGIATINLAYASEDTLFHEFAHPFVETIRRTNPRLFDSLTDELIREKSILLKTKKTYPELRGIDLISEAITQSIGEHAADTIESPRLLQLIREVLREIAKFMKEMFHADFILPSELSGHLTLRDLGVLMHSEARIPVLTYEGVQMQKVGALEGKKNGATEKQLEVLNTLIKNSDFITFDPEPHTYTDKNGIEYTPTTTVKGSTWTGPSSVGSNASTQGTQAHSILEAIVNGTEIPATPNIHDSARKQLIEYFTPIVEELTKDGSVLVAESIVSDTSSRVAGSIDLIRIRPSGSVDIYDLKTSGAYTSKPNKYQNKDYDSINSGNGIRRSKRQDHALQLSIYRALLEKAGFRVENMFIIPVKFNTMDKGELVVSAESEPRIEVKPNMEESNNLLKDRRKTFKNGQSSEQRDYTKFIDKLKILLQEKIDRIKESITTKSGATAERGAKLRGLLAGLQDTSDISGISTTIDSIHMELVDGTETTTSYLDKFDKLVQNVKSILDSQNPSEVSDAIRKLNIYHDYVNDFEGLDFLLEVYADSVKSKVKVEKGSPLDKLQQIIAAREAIKSQYTTAVAPLIARSLSDMISPEAQASAREYFNKKVLLEKERDLAITKGKMGQAESYQKQIDHIKKTFDGMATDEDKILMDLINPRSDMGVFEYLTGTLTGSNDSILGLFAKKIKAVFLSVDDSMNELQKSAEKEFNLFWKATGRNRDKPDEFNKGLFEVVTRYQKNKEGQWVAIQEKQFVNPLDENRYNRAVLEREQQADKISLDKTDKKRRKFINEWYRTHNQPRSQEEIDQIIADKKEELANKYITQEEYNTWEFENINKYDDVVTYQRDLTEPRHKLYSSSEYKAIQENPAMKRYYDYLVGLHLEAQKKYPISKELGYKLPSVGKQIEDIIREQGGWKQVLPHLKDSFFKTAKDTDRYNEHKIVPTHFTQYMPVDEVSNDLLASILQFSQATSKYEAIVGSADKEGIQEEARALLNVLKEREITKTDSKGRSLIKNAAKKLGLSEEVIEQKGGYVAAFAEHFIDQNLYDKGEDKVIKTIPEFDLLGMKFGGQTIDVGKSVNSIMSWFSVPALGGPFTILKALANKLNASYNVILEALAGQYFDVKAYRKGVSTYDAWMMRSMSSDFNSPTSQSKEGLLMDLFSPMQGTFRDKFGKEFTWSAAKKLMQPGTWFFLQNAGEHTTLNTMFFAMMHHTQVQQNGKSISLFNAYELNKEGVLQLKEGVEFNEKQRNEFINRVHAINKQLHGIYNRMDKSVAQKHALGRLAFMYRKFLVPAVKRRWGSIRMDHEMGNTVEGFHRTLVRTMVNDFKELMAFYIGKSTKLTALEKANLWRSTTELVAMMIFTGLIYAMMGMRKKDDKLKKSDTLTGYAFNATLYELMRMNSEIQAFLPIPGLGMDDALRTITSPSAANGTLLKLARFIGQLTSDPFETYDKSNKYYKKGESKLKTTGLSLLGVYSGDPLRAQEQFNKLYN